MIRLSQNLSLMEDVLRQLEDGDLVVARKLRRRGDINIEEKKKKEEE